MAEEATSLVGFVPFVAFSFIFFSIDLGCIGFSEVATEGSATADWWCLFDTTSCDCGLDDL